MASLLAEFLSGLAAKLTVNPISLDAYVRIKETIPLPPPATNGGSILHPQPDRTH